MEGSLNCRRFNRLVTAIKLILRVFSLASTEHKPKPLRKPKEQFCIQELAHPETRLKITQRVQQRLQQNAKPRVVFSEKDPIISDTVRRILHNSPWNRTSVEIEQVYLELQCCEAFKDFPSYLQKTLCKIGWYQNVGIGRVILREQDPPSCVYFILSGTVVVTKRRDDSSNSEETVNVLKAGASFGDMAIVHGTKRTTSCIANDKVELFAVSKSDYIDLSLRQARQSYQRAKHFAFCKTVGVLQHWPISVLETQPEVCKVSYFRPNAVIARDSYKSEWIYIVMSGSCRVVKRFIDSSDTTAALSRRLPGSSEFQTSKLALSNAHRLPPLTKKMDIKAYQERQNETFSQKRGHLRYHHRYTVASPQVFSEQSEVHRKQFLVQLQLLQPKDTFGLSPLVHSKEPSVTLVSNGAELVMISKDFIQQHLTDTIRSKLKRQIVRFPSQEAMLKRIREHHTWSIYKKSMMNQIQRRV